MRGIQQIEVARRLGKSPHWVGRCLNGRTHVPEAFRFGVAAILGLPPESCFYDQPQERPERIAS